MQGNFEEIVRDLEKVLNNLEAAKLPIAAAHVATAIELVRRNAGKSSDSRKWGPAAVNDGA